MAQGISTSRTNYIHIVSGRNDVTSPHLSRTPKIINKKPRSYQYDQ